MALLWLSFSSVRFSVTFKAQAFSRLFILEMELQQVVVFTVIHIPSSRICTHKSPLFKTVQKINLWFLPVKNPRFFENISQVDVCIQEIGIQGDGLFKMMNSQPNFALGIEDATQVTPGDGKVWSGFNCFQVASLQCFQVLGKVGIRG